MNRKFHVSGDDILEQAPDLSDIPLPDDRDAPPEDPDGFTAEEIAELQSQEPNIVSMIAGEVPSIRKAYGLEPLPDVEVPPIFQQSLRDKPAQSYPQPQTVCKAATRKASPERGGKPLAVEGSHQSIETPPSASPTPPLSGEAQNLTSVGVGTPQPLWWDGKRIDEVGFAREFLITNPLKCVGGELFDLSGRVTSDEPVKNKIYRLISDYVRSNIDYRLTRILAAVKRECAVASLDTDVCAVHVANGTYRLGVTPPFTTEMEFCHYRLPVEYNPSAKAPMRFLKFIHELFYEEDIPIIQEFIGYCLMPVTEAQKMLIIIGRGGEGKSTFGNLLLALFGSAAANGSLHALEASRFNAAELEHRLLMIDDDLKLDTLPSTNKIKTIVTAKEKILVEKKCQQPYLANMYCRLIGLGNLALESVSDKSVGFFRRQILIRTKDAERGRVDDPFLLGELKCELEGILNWAIEGLTRLVINNFRFTQSERAKQNLAEAMLEANNIPDFIHSPLLELGQYNEVSSAELYRCYIKWCSDNCETPLGTRQFVKFLKDSGARFGVIYSKSVKTQCGSFVRGFVGINVKA